MKRQLTRLARGYALALREHLRRGGRAGLLLAHDLGRRAVTAGAEAVDLARIHAAAVVGQQRGDPRAASFFNAAMVPILEAHRTARQTNRDLSRLQELLGERTAELASKHRELQRGVQRRKALEATAVKTGRHHKKSLQESLQLQKRLRHLTHRVLAAQEDERRKISRELHDEIAQTLLGINVRLLALKTEARTNSRGLKNEIARTQRLVVKSAQSVRRVAREFRNQ